MGQPSRLATRLPRSACLRTLQPLHNRNPLRRARGAGVGDERGLSTRFSNHHQEFIRRQPRGSFGANATLANRVTNTALSPALFGWGLRQRGVDNSVLQAPLSFICIQPTNLEYLSADCPSKQRWRVANKLANTDAATGRFGSPLRRAAVDKFIHNPPYLLFCSAKVTWRFTSRQASDALTITEAAFFQMSAVIPDS